MTFNTPKPSAFVDGMPVMVTLAEWMAWTERLWADQAERVETEHDGLCRRLDQQQPPVIELN